MMSPLTVVFLVALACVNSETFSGSGILDGAADVVIEIGATETTVTMTLNDGLTSVAGGYGLGFGGTTMSGTYAVLMDIAFSGTYTLGTREVTLRGPSNRGFDVISGADNWGITVDAVNGKLILTRDNDVSGSCSDCYTFSPTQTELKIAYAESVSSVGASSQFTNHGGGSGIKGGMTLDADTDMGSTEEPDTATMSDEYETCVKKTEIVSGVSVMIGRNTADKMVEITITGETDKYSGVGFGAKVMDGTYAIVVTGQETSDVVERTLGDHKGGDEITGDDKSFTSAESNTVSGSTQTVVIRRPYASDGTYDFTDLLTAEVCSIDAISAQGSSYTFEYHDSRAIGTLELESTCGTCSNDDGANNIFDVFYIGLVLVFSFYFVF